jgi:hypothetical protein
MHTFRKGLSDPDSAHGSVTRFASRSPLRWTRRGSRARAGRPVLVSEGWQEPVAQARADQALSIRARLRRQSVEARRASRHRGSARLPAPWLLAATRSPTLTLHSHPARDGRCWTRRWREGRHAKSTPYGRARLRTGGANTSATIWQRQAKCASSLARPTPISVCRSELLGANFTRKPTSTIVGTMRYSCTG